MKLNVGCGGRHLPGFKNIDIQATRAGKVPDIQADLRKIPLPDECAEEIWAIHVFEHFYRWECEDVIAEWKRLLKPNGLLVLELPNLEKACQNILHGKFIAGKHIDQIGMWALYGDPRYKDPYMIHRWAWTPKSLTDFLAENGFVGFTEKPTEFHPVGRDHRDMRIEAYKPPTSDRAQNDSRDKAYAR